MTYSPSYMIMAHTEDDTFNALKRVPFLSTWRSIGFEEGSNEKYNLEKVIEIGDEHEPGGAWRELFAGWTWKEYKDACRSRYDEKYK